MERGTDGAAAGGGSAAEHHLEVGRTARYWTLGDPAGDPEEVWVVLHGYGQLARRFLGRFDCLATERRLIVAPEGLSRFYIPSGVGRHGVDALVGATWMTREDRQAEIRDYVAYLDGVASAVVRGNPRVTVLGFSQGVATAWRWITYGSPGRLERLVSWAGAFPPDLDVDRAASALRGTAVTLVSGEKDATVRPEVAEEAAARLEAAGIALAVLRHRGGHDIDEDMLLRIAG